MASWWTRASPLQQKSSLPSRQSDVCRKQLVVRSMHGIEKGPSWKPEPLRFSRRAPVQRAKWAGHRGLGQRSGWNLETAFRAHERSAMRPPCRNNETWPITNSLWLRASQLGIAWLAQKGQRRSQGLPFFQKHTSSSHSLLSVFVLLWSAHSSASTRAHQRGERRCRTTRTCIPLLILFLGANSRPDKCLSLSWSQAIFAVNLTISTVS